VGRGEPPEVEPAEYERRLLQVFAQMKGSEPYLGSVVLEDAWLEGDHPNTEIAIVLIRPDRPCCRYIYRTPILGRDSNPEQAAYDIDIGVLEWSGTIRSIPWEPGMTHEPRPAREGVTQRRPGVL
jgi:hypothetical protein